MPTDPERELKGKSKPVTVYVLGDSRGTRLTTESTEDTE